MSFLGTLFQGKTRNTIDSISGLIDSMDNSTEKMKLQLDYKEMLLEIQQKSMEAESKMMELQTITTQKEIGGNLFQSSWRPTLMYVSILILTYNYFIAPILQIPVLPMDSKVWDLIMIGMGTYTAGRTLEKIAETVSLKDMLKKK